MCSSRKYPYPPTEGDENSEASGGGGGGIQKEAISSPGAPSTIDEQDISYFIFNQCFKAKIIFSSMIFYLPSAECVFFYFHGLHDSLLVYVVTRLSSTHG